MRVTVGPMIGERIGLRKAARNADAWATAALLVAALVHALGAALGARREAPPDPEPFRVDAGSRDAAEWRLLPGVGGALAARIVAERERGGPFASAADLDRRVDGVGPVRAAAWEPHLAFPPEEPR
jgi:DNA uptake protein ComE-like DNA-binding protein